MTALLAALLLTTAPSVKVYVVTMDKGSDKSQSLACVKETPYRLHCGSLALYMHFVEHSERNDTRWNHMKPPPFARHGTRR